MQPPQNYDPDSTSSGLVARLGSHDAACWERFVQAYGPLVYQWCRRLGLQSEDAADTGQVVFQSVFQKIDSFRESNHAFRAWLWQVTHNAVMDHYRRHEARAAGGSDAHQRLLEVPFSDSSSDGPREVALLAWRLMDTIQGDFEEKTWLSFWRTVIEGHPTADVAAELGLSQACVRQYRSRVLKRLRDELDGTSR